MILTDSTILVEIIFEEMKQLGSKANYILGAVTITLVIGGAVYFIKKSYDQKKIDEESMSVEDAMREVKAREEMVEENDIEESSALSGEEDFAEDLDRNIAQTGVKLRESIHNETARRLIRQMEEESLNGDYVDSDTVSLDNEHMQNLILDARDEASYNAGYLRPNIEEMDDDFEDDEDETEDDLLSVYNIGEEEDKVLRYEPNSLEALNQFKRMELAGWSPTSVEHSTLMRLFDFPFVPTIDGDVLLMERLIENRANFFGWNSRWTNEVSFADVILYYAKQTEFNIGEDVGYWVRLFLFDFNDFENIKSSREMDELIDSLNSHKHYNKSMNSYGLFGLSAQGYEDAVRIASGNIDQSLTYDIEFNEFLKGYL